MSFQVKVISRNLDNYLRETKKDIDKTIRNYKAIQDPFRQQIEYTRALNAAKLERVFAKPFIAALDGHNEGVHLLYKNPVRLATIFSGAADGQIKIWQLNLKKCLNTIQCHRGPVNDFSVDNVNGEHLVTVGQDCLLKIWNLPSEIDGVVISEPIHSTFLEGVAHSISHVSRSVDFVTSGEGISVWSLFRDTPIKTYNLGPNTIHNVKCNPIEDTIIAGCASDRSIFMLDSRQKMPLTKVVLKLRTNKISWNPFESCTFTIANEDYNLYTFDMRYLKSAKNVYHGHTMAVMDVDYAPTGTEFVSASYDRSVRIFNTESSYSREIYHGPRMHNVLSVLWSLDNKYILSGSDEMNIRLWKANASEKLIPLKPREKNAINYAQKLRETYKNHPEIGRILNFRQIPKHIYSAAQEHKIIRASLKRKQENLRRNTKKPIPYISERTKLVIKEGIQD